MKPNLVQLGVGGEAILNQVQLDAKAASASPRLFTGYAPPLTWGPDVNIASHIGSVTFTISYEPVGSTLVFARVKYYKQGAPGKVEEEFQGETTITTSNSVANIEIEFKGVPLGSAVEGKISP